MILETVSALLSRTAPEAEPAPDGGGDGSDEEKFTPAFYFAFTRREGLAVESLCERAAEYGLTWAMDEDFVFDVIR